MVVSTRCRCRHSERLLLVPCLAFAALASTLLQGAMAQTMYSTPTHQLQHLQDLEMKFLKDSQPMAAVVDSHCLLSCGLRSRS